jgi:GxxExxY protein
MDIDGITDQILNAAIAIHREFGPGLMESVYEAILARELELRGFGVRRQQSVRFSYAGMVFDEAFRADLIVNDTVIVELKAVARMEPVFARQLLTYLRLLKMPVGIVLNFGAPKLTDGIKRVVNNFPASSPSRLRVNAGASWQCGMKWDFSPPN